VLRFSALQRRTTPGPQAPSLKTVGGAFGTWRAPGASLTPLPRWSTPAYLAAAGGLWRGRFPGRRRRAGRGAARAEGHALRNL